MGAVNLLFRVDIGHDKDRGYAAMVTQAMPGGATRQKGIRGNSIEQLVSRLRNVLLEEGRKMRNFPLEHEAGQPAIITPEQGDPLFKQV